MVSYKALNTVIESTISDTCHRIGDCDRGEAGAAIESLISDTCHRIGNRDRGETGAAIESPFSDTCHRIWDCDRSEVGAVRESLVSDTCHGIGNRDRGETGATIESKFSDTCHVIHLPIYENCFWNRNLSSISTTCDFCCFFLCNKVIINTIDYDVIRQGSKGKAYAEYERSNEESKTLFHNRRLQTHYLSHKVWRWLRVKNSQQSYNKRLLSPNFHSSFC